VRRANAVNASPASLPALRDASISRAGECRVTPGGFFFKEGRSRGGEVGGDKGVGEVWFNQSRICVRASVGVYYSPSQRKLLEGLLVEI